MGLIPEISDLDLMLFNVFTNDLVEGLENMSVKLWIAYEDRKDSKQLKGHIKIQEESNTLEQWAKVSKIVWDKNKVPCLSKKN